MPDDAVRDKAHAVIPLDEYVHMVNRLNGANAMLREVRGHLATEILGRMKHPNAFPEKWAPLVKLVHESVHTLIEKAKVSPTQAWITCTNLPDDVTLLSRSIYDDDKQREALAWIDDKQREAFESSKATALVRQAWNQDTLRALEQLRVRYAVVEDVVPELMAELARLIEGLQMEQVENA